MKKQKDWEKKWGGQPLRGWFQVGNWSKRTEKPHPFRGWRSVTKSLFDHESEKVTRLGTERHVPLLQDMDNDMGEWDVLSRVMS